MGVGPVDAFSLVLPRGLPEQAAGAVLALRRASNACRAAVRTLDTAPGPDPGWDGAAAQEYRHRRARLSRRCAELDEVTAHAAALVATWAAQATPQRDTLIRARTAIEEITRAEAAAAGAGQYYRPDLTAAHDAAFATWTTTHDDYTAGITRLAQHLHATRDQVTDRPLDLADHAQAFLQRVWDDAVAAPAEQVWALTGQALVDPDAWLATLTALPGQAHDLIDRAVHDPLAVLEDLVDADAWRTGHFGEALGTAAAVFIPTPKWLELGPAHSADHVLAGMSRVTRTLPRLQTVDELLDHVDLDRHEYPGLGHTLDRHVEVTDDYLMDRLTHGTLEPDGHRGPPPAYASRFTDRTTAETAITEALRRNEREVRDFAADPASGLLTISAEFDSDIGVRIVRAAGGFAQEDVRHLTVQLTASKDGTIYVKTAYVGVEDE